MGTYFFRQHILISSRVLPYLCIPDFKSTFARQDCETAVNLARLLPSTAGTSLFVQLLYKCTVRHAAGLECKSTVEYSDNTFMVSGYSNVFV